MLQPAAPVSFYQPTVAASRIVYTAASTWSIRWDGYGVRAHAKPAYNNSTAMGIASVQPFDFSTLKPEGQIGAKPGAPYTENFAQAGVAGCFGGCVDISVLADSSGMHVAVNIGFGTEFGISAYAGVGPGKVNRGWSSGASCSSGPAYFGGSADHSGDFTPSAGLNFPVVTRFGCATTFGYTL